MLYLRYQRSPSADRRRIRWLLTGAGGAVVVFAAFATLSWALGPGPLQVASVFFLWALTLVLVLGSLAVALSNDAILGIDRSARRSVVYRALWLLIAVVYVAAVAALGLLAGRYLPAGAAVLLAAGAAVAFQPVQRRLERLADRWVFGARLDGYAVLTRFGSMLETSPGPADLLPQARRRDTPGAWPGVGTRPAGRHDGRRLAACRRCRRASMPWSSGGPGCASRHWPGSPRASWACCGRWPRARGTRASPRSYPCQSHP
jgi:hypothetical protein